MTKTTRPTTPEHRVTIQNVAEWHSIRNQHDEYAMDLRHNSNHITKAHGYIAAFIDHDDHDEDPEPIPDKRMADLIIHAIWAARAAGKDPAAIVANRMWELGINPIRNELPPGERQ